MNEGRGSEFVANMQMAGKAKDIKPAESESNRMPSAAKIDAFLNKVVAKGFKDKKEAEAIIKRNIGVLYGGDVSFKEFMYIQKDMPKLLGLLLKKIKN